MPLRPETQKPIDSARSTRVDVVGYWVLYDGPGTNDLSEDRSLCRRLRGARALYTRSARGGSRFVTTSGQFARKLLLPFTLDEHAGIVPRPRAG